MLLSNGALTQTSLGDSMPSIGADTFSPSLGGVSLLGSFATYGSVYRSQPWISALVNKIAYGTARLPLKVYERGDGDARTEARESGYARLLREPNPRHDPFFFWLWTASTVEVYGEAMWVKVRPARGRAPSQLWPMHPANVTIRRDKTTGEVFYRYVAATVDGKPVEWPSDDVVHFKTYNPDDQSRGLSRLEPLRQTLLSEDAARRAAQAMWSNGGRPSFVVSTPGQLSDGAFRRLQANVAGLHQGVDNWGKIAILEEGLTPHTFTVDASAMQFVEARKVNQEEACGVYDVPPPAVHILDRATFSNITEQMRMVYRDTMAPRLKLYESALEFQLRPDFDPQGNTYAEWLLDEVMRGAFEQRAAANQSAIFSGQRTPNEARKQDNLPPLEGGDRLYINAGAVPLVSPSGEPIQEPPAEEPVTLASAEKCAACGAEAKTSARNLCRSCEGRASRMLAANHRKEVAA